MQKIIRSEAGSIEGHRWLLFHTAGRCFAAAMRLVPRPWRFGAALFVARAVAPLAHRTQAYREQQASKVDGEREIALHFVLSALTKSSITFAPSINVRGYDEVRRAYAAGKGLLVIGPHTALNLVLVRLFHDDGLEPVVITPDSLMRVSGTKLIAQTVQPSPTFLVRTRDLLRNGRLVCAMPDRAEHQEGRTLEFETAKGSVIIAPALMQIAARCGAQVIFTEVHVEGHEMVATMVAPSADCERSADCLTRRFIEFVRAHIESRAVR